MVRPGAPIHPATCSKLRTPGTERCCFATSYGTLSSVCQVLMGVCTVLLGFRVGDGPNWKKHPLLENGSPHLPLQLRFVVAATLQASTIAGKALKELSRLSKVYKLKVKGKKSASILRDHGLSKPLSRWNLCRFPFYLSTNTLGEC